MKIKNILILIIFMSILSISNSQSDKLVIYKTGGTTVNMALSNLDRFEFIIIEVPTNLSATFNNSEVLLEWDEASESDITYNIYRRLEGDSYNYAEPLASDVDAIEYLDESIEYDTVPLQKDWYKNGIKIKR